LGPADSSVFLKDGDGVPARSRRFAKGQTRIEGATARAHDEAHRALSWRWLYRNEPSAGEANSKRLGGNWKKSEAVGPAALGDRGALSRL